MAPYAALFSDQQVADVVTFIQTGWGNRGKSATSAEVAKVRKTVVPLPVPAQ
jgi:mono/diheme cytochrome c family protein